MKNFKHYLDFYPSPPHTYTFYISSYIYIRPLNIVPWVSEDIFILFSAICLSVIQFDSL